MVAAEERNINHLYKMANTNQQLDYLPSRIDNQPNYFTITPGDVPVRNEVSTSKDNNETEKWSGWVKVDIPSTRNCRITAMVDDNGSFTINGVTSEIPEGEHGDRRYTPEATVTLDPGYYFVTCRLQDLPPLNQSYKNIKHYQALIKWDDDDGNEVTQEVSQLYDIEEKGLRDVTIVITSNIIGTFSGAKTYPFSMVYSDDNSLCLYDVPIYQMLVKGRNNAGEYVEYSFGCLRYMPVLREGESNPTMVGLEIPNASYIDGCLAIYPSLYDASYKVHSNDSAENGGIILYDDFLIHDGPDDNDDIFGGAGCIEMFGPEAFSSLISTIMGLTGSTASDPKTNLESLMSSDRNKLLVLIEEADIPPLKENSRRVDIFEED